MDLDEDLAPHMWRFIGIRLGAVPEPGTDYVCELCGQKLLVPPGGVHPEEC